VTTTSGARRRAGRPPTARSARGVAEPEHSLIGCSTIRVERRRTNRQRGHVSPECEESVRPPQGRRYTKPLAPWQSFRGHEQPPRDASAIRRGSRRDSARIVGRGMACQQPPRLRRDANGPRDGNGRRLDGRQRRHERGDDLSFLHDVVGRHDGRDDAPGGYAGGADGLPVAEQPRGRAYEDRCTCGRVSHRLERDRRRRVHVASGPAEPAARRLQRRPARRRRPYHRRRRLPAHAAKERVSQALSLAAPDRCRARDASFARKRWRVPSRNEARILLRWLLLVPHAHPASAGDDEPRLDGDRRSDHPRREDASARSSRRARGRGLADRGRTAGVVAPRTVSAIT
jgi:hypothetical protein